MFLDNGLGVKEWNWIFAMREVAQRLESRPDKKFHANRFGLINNCRARVGSQGVGWQLSAAAKEKGPNQEEYRDSPSLPSAISRSLSKCAQKSVVDCDLEQTEG